MSALEFVPIGHQVDEGPVDIGTEQRWRVRTSDGRAAVVAQLAPDLARDESIRRRWVRDVLRVRELGAISVAPILAVGPDPDPRDPGASPPWRLRLDPEGETFEAILQRAPLPLEQFSELFAGLADAVHAVHATGAVIRDLRPQQVVRTHEGRIVLTDIGLSRVDVLSSHTASSLLLQGSAYAAPEQLAATAVDQRSDIYSLGVLMWKALTGELPFSDGPGLLLDRHELPPLHAARADVPGEVDALVHSCLSEDPAKRPASVAEVAWVLRGGSALARGDETTTCQSCGSALRVGQRLCLSCGKVAVRFEHAQPGEPVFAVDLLRLSEDAAQLQWLQDFLVTVARPPVHKPEFIIGSVHMYGEDERRGRIRLPARLFGNLSRQTAMALSEAMRERGLKVRVVEPTDAMRAGWRSLAAVLTTAALGVGLSLLGFSPLWAVIPGVVVTLVFMVQWTNRVSDRRKPPRFALRPMPAALPASDPLVARLAALIQDKPRSDVRAVVDELALLVQRLVDHRASFSSPNPERTELELVSGPVQPLVEAVEQQVHQLQALDAEMADLDEATMVRALAASEARGDPPSAREPILEGLDRLRTLEDQRARIFHRLLEVQTLLRRTINLGLSVHDPQAEHDRNISLALATLSGHS